MRFIFFVKVSNAINVAQCEPIELWYKRKKDEDLREQISNVFWISDIQHRRSDKIFLDGGRGGGGGRGEVMKKLKIKNNLYNFLCLSLYINLIVNKNQTYVSLKMKTEKQ